MSRTSKKANQKTIFTAGENVPSPVEVSAGKNIVNHSGNIALESIIIDPNDSKSSIELDESVEPAVLRLKKAMAVTSFGYVDSKGEFRRYSNDIPTVVHFVSGDYSGPGSKLDIF